MTLFHSRFAAVIAGLAAMTAAAAAKDDISPNLTRLATLPLGAEVTGLFMHEGDVFFNVQHPAKNLASEFSKATVGVVSQADFSAGHVELPKGREKHIVKTTLGDYQILLQEGDFGKIGVISGKGGVIRESNNPDFNAYIPVSDGEGYLFTNWEDTPGGMSRTRISRGGDGVWSVDPDDTMMIDFMSVEGTWSNSFGTVSPWGTPLSSEELYFDETSDWNNPDLDGSIRPDDYARYLGKFPNPYRVGYLVEIRDPTGEPTPVKLMVMGRFSHENAVVMPDSRTAYMPDDGNGAVFFKFIADSPGDLTSGTLYAAKVTQLGEPRSDASETSLGIEWIELARGTNEEVESWVAEYDGVNPGDYRDGQTSYVSDEEIAAWARGEAKDDRAAFLEPRKAAIAKGATGEFRKMESVNINLKAAADGTAPYLYLAIAKLDKDMSDRKGDIQLRRNRCGLIYRMKLDGDYNISEMTPVIAGGPYDRGREDNACHVGNIAGPDNLLVMDDGTLLIGEDTFDHENNVLWAWRDPGS